MSFKKWVHAVQFDRGEPARAAVRKSCRISFHTGMQHVHDAFPAREVLLALIPLLSPSHRLPTLSSPS
jgi:hypothetical protein